MQRFFALLIAAIASAGLAFAQAPATKDAKKDTPKAEAKADSKADAKKDAKAEPKKADAKKAELIDINSASEKELASLPGIGEVRAKAIVKGRPYKGKNELLDKKIVPANVYKDISESIIAKQK
jgi:competence protein ComEA